MTHITKFISLSFFYYCIFLFLWLTIHRDGDDIYDATLISTDIGYNIFGSNKYFHLQLQVYTAQPKVTMKGITSPLFSFLFVLTKDIGKVLPSTEAQYRIYTSTARIGDYSPQENKDKYYKLEEAKKEFKDMFYHKTQNNWQVRFVLFFISFPKFDVFFSIFLF